MNGKSEKLCLWINEIFHIFISIWISLIHTSFPLNECFVRVITTLKFFPVIITITMVAFSKLLIFIHSFQDMNALKKKIMGKYRKEIEWWILWKKISDWENFVRWKVQLQINRVAISLFGTEDNFLFVLLPENLQLQFDWNLEIFVLIKT